MALTQSQVSQLYVAIFNRASEGEGSRYWQNDIGDMAAIADFMLETDSAKQYFGSSLNSNEAFIKHIYRNSLGREPDKEGLNYWIGELNKGRSRGTVIKDIVYVAKDTEPVFKNKVYISNYTADRLEKATVNDINKYQSIIKNVTAESSTVRDAENIVKRMAAEITLNILVIGQSNIANYGVGNDNVLKFQTSRQLTLSKDFTNGNSNLLCTGPSGNKNMMGIIGKSILSKRIEYHVVNFYNTAVGGTSIKQWLKVPTMAYDKSKTVGDNYPYKYSKLFERIEFAKSVADREEVKFDCILINLGETDNQINTSTLDYKASMTTLFGNLKDINIPTNKIIISKTSYDGKTTNSNITGAQNALVNENNYVYWGPNTDNYISTKYRYDNLHFNEEGLKTIGLEWANAILKVI